MVRRIPFFATNAAAANNGTAQDTCNYSVHLYPSITFVKSFDSNVAAFAAATVGATFILVALIFAAYDYMVHSRNKKITAVAERSNAVVRSLFPETVRDRLMEGSDQNAVSKLKDGESADGASKSRPIADLFPETTIMFADIAGFTAWASTREPCQGELMFDDSMLRILDALMIGCLDVSML